MTDSNTDFVQESRNQLREISNAIIELEDNPDDRETMNAIFRVAHTMKGNAGAMGFDLMSELAHAIEDVLDEVRSGNIEVTSDLIDLLLKHGIDKIETQIDELEEEGEIKTLPEESVEKLRDKAPKKEEERESSKEINDEVVNLESATTEDIQSIVEEINTPDEHVNEIYHVRVLVSDLEKEAIEAGQMSAIGQLHDAFTVLGTNPPEEDIEDGNYGETFDAIIETEIGSKNLKAALNGIKLVEERLVEPASKYVDWAGETVSIDSDEEQLDDDVTVDELLDSASEYDDIDDFDDSIVDGIKLDDQFNEADGGTFNVTIEDDEDEPDEDDEAEEENKGARLFDDLREEEEYTDDFDVIEQEMEDVGFDELDDDEMSFEEVLNIEPDDDDDVESEEVVDEPTETDVVEDEPTEPEETEFDGIDLGVTDDADEDSEINDVFGNGSDETETSDSDIDDIFDSGFEPETTEADLVEEVETDSDVDLDVDVDEQFDTGTDDTDDFDEFGSAFDTSDSDGLTDFDELLREAGRTPASDKSSGPDIQSIPVGVEKLDDLYSLMQEFITNRIRLRRAVEEGKNDPQALIKALDDLDDLEKVSSRMQDTIMDIRLVPLERAVDKLPRIARDVSREHDKDVNFSMEGTDVELDRAVLKEISDPLMHLIRNAVDHGIETPEEREKNGKNKEGNVKLTAQRVRDTIHITISDDGAGIDADSIRQTAVEDGLLSEQDAEQLSDSQAYELVFRPGFTTADEVTETSGRGVGMDVVYSTIRRLDGSLDVESEVGKGTQVNIRVPVSLAIEEVMFLNVGDETYGIPIKNVDEMTYVENIKDVDGQEAHSYNGEIYPVIDLKDELDVTESDSNKGDERLIRVSNDVRQVALKCDGVNEQEEIVVEPFDGVLSSIPGLSGAATLGEGNIINILDVETL